MRKNGKEAKEQMRQGLTDPDHELGFYSAISMELLR